MPTVLTKWPILAAKFKIGRMPTVLTKWSILAPKFKIGKMPPTVLTKWPILAPKLLLSSIAHRIAQHLAQIEDDGGEQFEIGPMALAKIRDRLVEGPVRNVYGHIVGQILAQNQHKTVRVSEIFNIVSKNLCKSCFKIFC